jgi:CHAT domain-containing protein
LINSAFTFLRFLLLHASCLIVSCWAIACSAQQVNLTLAAGEIRLMEVRQTGADLVVKVTAGSQSFEVSHPLGNTGPELFVVGPYPVKQTVTLAARVLDGISPSALSLNSTVLSPTDPALRDYRLLTEAGILFGQQKKQEMLKALSLYQSIDVRHLPEKWRFYPVYLAAEVEYFLFDLPAVRSQLAMLPLNACAVPNFCYKDDLLLAEVGFAQDDYRSSVNLYQAVVDAINASEYRSDARADLTIALVELGISQAITSKSDEALTNLTAAMALAEQLKSDTLYGEVFNGLATYYVQGSEPNLQRVADYLQKAVGYLEKSSNVRSYISAVSNLSSTYNYLGEFRKVQEIALAALPKAEQSADKSLAVTLYADLMTTSTKLGDWDPAEHYARSLIALEQASDRKRRIYAARNSLGAVLREKGQILEAEQQHQAALAFFQTTDNTQAISATLAQLMKDAMARRDYVQADAYLNQIEAIADPGSPWFSREELLEDQVKLWLAQQNPKKALKLLLPEWKLISGAETNLDHQIQTAGLLLETYIALKDFAAADVFGETLITLSADMRGQLEHLRLGAAWSASIHKYFERYAEALIHQYVKTQKRRYLERALAVLEASRGQNLLLERTAAAAREASGDEEKTAMRRRLAEVSNRRAAQLVGTPEYQKYSLEYFQLLEKFQADYLQTTSDSSTKSNFSLAELRTKLGADKLLVEFLCLPESECHAVVVSDKDLAVLELGEFDQIQELAASVVSGVRNPGEDTQELRKKLGSLLFGKLMEVPALAAKKSLLLVVDFPLNNLPFAALLLDDKTTLAQRFQVSNIASIGSYDPNQQDLRQHALDMAVFADPVFTSQAVKSNAGNSSNFMGWLESLDRLRWSAVEAQNLQALFNAADMKVYLGKSATRVNLLMPETRNARVLHIASHAYYNESMQDLVGIAFSAENPTSAGDFLTLEELFEFPFGADLVVISGCDTGVGAYQPGEGNQSLAHGFMAQGANHVISTLWPVSDRASVEFMRAFYGALSADKANVALALQTAQIALANSPEFADPFYWAPYTLSSVR